MLLILNGKITFEYQYCQQCGSCLAVCPTKSLIHKIPDLRNIILR